MKIKQILLREDIHDRLKIAAINNHTSVMKLTEQVMTKFLNHHEAGLRQGPAEPERVDGASVVKEAGEEKTEGQLP